MEGLFDLTSIQIGLLNSVFGVIAVICYFPSGYLADRYSARSLITISLLSTGAGGFIMLLEPSFYVLLILHSFWGVSSILTFWAALIKATRDWGDDNNQGKGFGYLDAGRGVVAALLASIATYGFSLAKTSDIGMQTVLLIYSISPILCALFIWKTLPKNHLSNSTKNANSQFKIRDLKDLIGQPKIWSLSIIIFCAYTLYVGIFDFPAFVEKAFNQSKSFGAVLGTSRDWMRPIAAVSAGILADKYKSSFIIKYSFFTLIILFLSVGVFSPDFIGIEIFWIGMILIALAVFALRAVYFALMQEIKIPISQTGVSVGLISLVGYTPDTFLHLLSGWFVTYFGDVHGYQYFFTFLAFIALVGWLFTKRLINSLA